MNNPSSGYNGPHGNALPGSFNFNQNKQYNDNQSKLQYHLTVDVKSQQESNNQFYNNQKVSKIPQSYNTSRTYYGQDLSSSEKKMLREIYRKKQENCVLL